MRSTPSTRPTRPSTFHNPRCRTPACGIFFCAKRAPPLASRPEYAIMNPIQQKGKSPREPYQTRHLRSRRHRRRGGCLPHSMWAMMATLRELSRITCFSLGGGEFASQKMKKTKKNIRNLLIVARDDDIIKREQAHPLIVIPNGGRTYYENYRTFGPRRPVPLL